MDVLDSSVITKNHSLKNHGGTFFLTLGASKGQNLILYVKVLLFQVFVKKWWKQCMAHFFFCFQCLPCCSDQRK